MHHAVPKFARPWRSQIMRILLFCSCKCIHKGALLYAFVACRRFVLSRCVAVVRQGHTYTEQNCRRSRVSVA